MKILRQLVYSGIWIGVALTAAQAELGEHGLFERGNSAYAEGRFDDATVFYREVLNMDLHSPELHFNLGSAYAQQEKYGLTILHFERALLLDPDNGEIRANLDHVATLARLNVPDWNWWESASFFFSANTWAFLAMAGFWCAVILLIVPPLVGSRRRRFYGWATTAFSIALVAVAALWVQHPTFSSGVVITSDAVLKVAPTESSPIVSQLREGSQLSLIRYDRGHYYVVNERGEPGWVAETDYAPLVDPSP